MILPNSTAVWCLLIRFDTNLEDCKVKKQSVAIKRSLPYHAAWTCIALPETKRKLSKAVVHMYSNPEEDRHIKSCYISCFCLFWRMFLPKKVHAVARDSSCQFEITGKGALEAPELSKTVKMTLKIGHFDVWCFLKCMKSRVDFLSHDVWVSLFGSCFFCKHIHN